LILNERIPNILLENFIPKKKSSKLRQHPSHRIAISRHTTQNSIQNWENSNLTSKKRKYNDFIQFLCNFYTGCYQL